MRHSPVVSAVPSHVSLVPFIATGETVAVASVPVPSVPVDAAAVGAESLHEDEIARAASMSAHRRETFLAGRAALRFASRATAPQLELPALLTDHRGAPQLPSGVVGSISHKRTRAVAAALAGARGHIGIDLEGRASSADLHRPSIATRILTARELDAIHALDPLAHREATLLRFALKEAIYKAIDPIVQRYVGFTEVELDVHDDGQVTVHLLLPEFAHVAPAVHAQWFIDDVWFIALARSHP
jgi:4'-phosphopantetheinyl transferase EntD